MKKPLFCCVLLLLLCPQLRAQPKPEPKVVKDTWDAAYLEGAKIGWFRTLVTVTESDGKKITSTTLSMELTIRRYNSVVKMRMDSETRETPDGKVVGMTLTQYLDQGKQVVWAEVTGEDKLIVGVGDQRRGQLLPWDPKAIGPQAQERLPAERKVKPGDRYDYLNYELALRQAIKVSVVVGQPEEVDILVPPTDPKGKAERVKKRLLRMEASSDKVKVGENLIELPKLTSWVDEEYRTLRSEMEMPGLGVLTLYRSTEAVARQEGVAPHLLPDSGLNTLVPLNQRVEGMHDRKEAVYRITIKNDSDPASSFARDARQEASNVKENSFELRVRAIRQPPPEGGRPVPVKEEFLKSNDFVTSDDAAVKELAAKAVGAETDPWKKALRIEKWVHDNMTPNTGIGFATAAQTARDLKGDCRQHALLSAAMCRAAGVPSRTALGLVYYEDRERGPVLGFHMWTEVFIRGEWLGLDATLGKGGVGPGHLKINDHSWHDTQSLAPLLPVIRVMGRVRVEVLRAE
jgi:hypothetical protein